MKGRKWAGRGLLLLGLAPFLSALGFCLVSCLLDSGRTSFWEYLVMWSFLYWYTYVIGMILLVLSAVLREKS
ncbi:hypothetical protein D1641_10640 [Colidextribacter sp. OB.20]|nr:hypothetical protein [Colidextribacter sp. OB.20]